jgi:hypothetical protein
MTLQGYYNRFSQTDGYDELLFRASKGLQSAELNEIQSILSDKVADLGDALFNDGNIVRGGAILIDANDGSTTLGSATLWVRGSMRDIAASTFTIPTTGSVLIGVRMVETDVTELEDPNLRDPATGTRNYNEPGAGRTKREFAWAYDSDGGAGTFYAVVQVQDAIVVDQADPPEIDSVTQVVARYDREANGNYVVRGLKAVSLGEAGGNYGFSVSDGTANVRGQKIDKIQSVRLNYALDPDTETINNEPDGSTTAGTQTVQMNRFPLDSIQDCVIVKEDTTTVTHGAFTGSADQIGTTSTLSIQSVTQGGTTYASGTDYVLNGDSVDWSPSGAEPAPGSTYTVTYRRLISVTPANVDNDAGTFEVVDAVQGTQILTDYTYKLPRVDVVGILEDGQFSRTKGVPHPYTPIAPALPADELELFSITHNWISTAKPVVEDISNRTVSVKEQRLMQRSIIELYDLIATERLNVDISSREPTAKYGLFVDPGLDDDLRDNGQPNDLVFVNQELQLPISAVNYAASQNNSDPALLPFTSSVILSQSLATGFFRVNPYGAFDPAPGTLTLDPNHDTWTEIDSNQGNPAETITRRFWQGSGNRSRTTTSNTIELQSSVESDIEFLRQRQVDFTANGFENGEELEQVRFDDVRITSLENNPSFSADTNGVIQGSFNVPPNIPAGNKLVEFIGEQGTYSAAQYFGQGTLITERWANVRTITTVSWWQPARRRDPVAQTFMLQYGRFIKSVNVQFAEIGDTDKPVLVQIRETENGFPNGTVLADGVIDMASATTAASAFTQCNFFAPVYLNAEQEYAIVLISDDTTHAVRVAQAGKFDTAQQAYVTTQPYQIGLLLTSSNNATWTAHQDTDLTFQLEACSFTQNQSVVSLGSFSASNMTDLLASGPHYLPTSETSIVFRYTRSNGEVYELAPGQSIPFEVQITDTVQVQAILKGTTNVTPVLFPGFESVIGTLDGNGNYTGREFQVGAGGNTFRLIVDAQVPAGSTLTPQYDNGGQTSLSLSTAANLGDGFTEYVYEATGIVGLSSTRVYLNLLGTPAARPKVRNIRAVVVQS